tara:strand:- start:766 stop:1902 length:1137 start_codon:yes stop_codon:yes gene_type:complete
MKTKLALLLGIRPDIIRATKIIKLLDESPEVDLKFIWSGQHYSDNLKSIFFRELNLRNPDYELGCSGETDAEVVSKVITNLYRVLQEIQPEAIIFLGDTNTNCGALAASQLNIPIIHIEGCMRSYDWRMPEEKYRTMVDNLSDVIYTYLDAYKEKGLKEGIPENRMVVTGNPIVDILKEYFSLERANQYSETLKNYEVVKDDYYLMTCHRRENVESKIYLKRIVDFISKSKYKILFPASYRTQKNLENFNIILPNNIEVVDPIGYYDFLHLMNNSRAVLTDSGTVVEEACVLKIPSIQMRFSTERPEVYDVGASVQFDPTKEHNETEIRGIFDKTEFLRGKSWENPFGDGKASERIVEDIIQRIKSGKGFDTHNKKNG